MTLLTLRRIAPLTLVAAFVLSAPALAQSGGNGTKPQSGASGTKSKPSTGKKPQTPRVMVSSSPIPTYDENTAERISAAMLSYAALDVQGGWPTLPKDAKLVPGATGPEVATLRKRLAITDDLPADEINGDAYDDRVTTAVKRFQARHGLEETGSVGPQTLSALNVTAKQRLRQLGASMDRLAAMDFQFGQRYVVVNLPAAYVEAVDGDKVVRRHTVQVGRADRPSPTLTTHVTTVNLNPTWTVPLGILKKDIIPKMRQDPGYAARMHMRVFDASGQEVDPHAIDWNSDRAPNFTIRQDSGPWNALGSLRIDMPNPHSVYMHDTNHKELFSRDYRFQSSGCTRVEDPRALATWLLQDNNGWGRREIDAAIAKGDRTDVRLTNKVPVAWVYLTGWATRDGTIHFRDDVYGHDDKPAPDLVAGNNKRSKVADAGRTSGFVLQSADPEPPPQIKQVSYLDSQ